MVYVVCLRRNFAFVGGGLRHAVKLSCFNAVLKSLAIGLQVRVYFKDIFGLHNTPFPPLRSRLFKCSKGL